MAHGRDGRSHMDTHVLVRGWHFTGNSGSDQESRSHAVYVISMMDVMRGRGACGPYDLRGDMMSQIQMFKGGA